MISYKIIAEHQLLITTNEGETPIDELLEFISRLRQNPAFSMITKIISDSRRLKTEYNRGDIERIIAVQSQASAKHELKRVILTAPGLNYGLGRMYEMMSENKLPIDTLATDDPNEALEFLGVSGIDLDNL